MRIHLKKAFVIGLFIIQNSVFATHISGGNITYECTGNPDEYLITLTLYRDCGGVSAPTTPSIDFSNSCGLTNPPNLALTIDNILTAEISQLCPGVIGQSECNGGTFPGYEQYVYTGLVTLPGPCDSWTLSYDICNRNAATNLTGGTSNCFYIESQIYSATNNCNTSPSIVTDYPVPYVCNGQPVSHDFGVVEPDGNTLQFSFVNALDQNGVQIAYNGGYSANSPIQGITIDPNTGQLNFTPNTVGNFVVTVLIEEFDVNGNLIGSTMHDTQFVVENCTNQAVSPPPPGGTNFQNNGTNATFTGGNTITMCDGDSFCVDFVFSDADINDTLYLSTNASSILPGATFTQTGTNPATGTLCWNYQSGYLGNLISISATDSACPTISTASFLLYLDIPPPFNVSSNDTICGNQVASLQAFGTLPVTWSVISGDPIQIGTNFSCNPCTSPDATPSITTTYQVQDGSVCQLTDTITVAVVQNEGNIDATIVTNDTTVCAGNCFTVDATATEIFSGTTPVNYYSGTSYNIQDNQTITSQIYVTGLNMTTMNVGSIASVCLDITHTFDGDLDIYLICPDGTQFMLSTDNGGGGDNYTNTCFTLNATQQISSGSAPFTGNFIPEGGVLSSAMVGCTANGLWGLQIGDDAGGDQGTLNNWSITFNDAIASQGAATSINWSNLNGIVDPTIPNTQICPTQAGQYVLYAYDVDNCWDSDTINIAISPGPNAGTDSIINICKQDPQIDLFSYIGGTPDIGGVWLDAFGNNISQFALPDTIPTGSIYAYLVDVNGCQDTSYITVNVYNITATTVIDDSDCNACNGSITITPNGYYGSINDVQFAINSGVFQTSNQFNNLCGGVPGTVYSVMVQDSLGCQLTFNDTVVDDNFPQLQSITNTDSECGLDNGEVSAAVTVGGTPPYTYVVEGITSPFQNLPIQNLPPSTPNTFNLIVEDFYGCHDTLDFVVNQINPPVITDTIITHNICNGGTSGQIEVIGNNLNYFSIDNGITVQTSNVFTNLAAGIYEIIAYSSDPFTTNACATILSNIEITEPNPLDVYDITPSTSICPGDSIEIMANTQGGLGNSVLSWEVNGAFAGNTNSIFVSVTNQPKVVCAILTEGNCPSDSICTLISLPTPIIPSFTTDINEGCYPVNVVFTNTSTNISDIQSVEWDFGAAGSTSGVINVNYTFPDPGTYDVHMTVWSVYGCVYDTVYPNYIVVHDYPNANFTSTPIPVTIYETDVQFQDLSSEDVVSWHWDLGAGAIPQFSTESNPSAYYPEGIPGIYPVTLVVANEFDCRDTLIGQVEVINDVIIYAPNVFTPDNDQFNQTWRVYIAGIDVYDFHLTIFNRWGEIVWESYNPEGVWKGAYGSNGDVLDGTYVWVINAKDSYNDKKYEFRGTVSILR